MLFSQCQNWKNLYVASWRSVIALTLGYINFQIYQGTGCELLGLHSKAAEASNLLGYETVPHPDE